MISPFVNGDKWVYDFILNIFKRKELLKNVLINYNINSNNNELTTLSP